MKKNTKKTRVGTLTVVLIFVVICVTLTTISDGVFSPYYTENGFTQPESDIRWIPSLRKQETVQDVISKEQIHVINQISDIKRQVKVNQHGKPYFLASKPENEKHLIQIKESSLNLEFQEILNLSPLVLFYESSNEMGKKIKNILLNEYDIYPEMTIVDLDKYHDRETLLTHIKQQVFPAEHRFHSTYLFLKGVPLIYEDLEENFMDMHSKNVLMERVNRLGKNDIIFNKIYLPSNN